MPFAEFQPGNAGLALPTFALQSAEAASSLMERAQRRKMAETDFEMRQQKHAADLATTDLTQQKMRAELSMQEMKFRETERTVREAADVRGEYNRVAPNIDEALRVIQGTTDPFEQRRLLTQLETQAARFSKDPQVMEVLTKQMSSTQALIKANEDSKLQDYISTNQYATNRAEAQMMFPGQALRTITRPGPVPGAPPSMFFVPTGKADPQMEAQAMSLLNVARVSGDVGKVEAILQDPAVQSVLRVPGSAFSAEYMKAVQTMTEFARKREADKRAQDDQQMQRQKFEQDKAALTAEGYDGTAKTEAEAKEFRKDQTEMGNVLNGISEVRRLGNEYLGKNWASSPIEKARLQKLAKQQVGMIVGALRIPITGPGAMTDSEREFIEELNGNPTKIFSLAATEFALLESMEKKFNTHLDLKAKAIGLGPRKDASGSGAPSTPSDTVSYQGGNYKVLKADPSAPGMILVQDPKTNKVFRIPDERTKPKPAEAQPRS
jgi:hypothetical protein